MKTTTLKKILFLICIYQQCITIPLAAEEQPIPFLDRFPSAWTAIHTTYKVTSGIVSFSSSAANIAFWCGVTLLVFKPTILWNGAGNLVTFLANRAIPSENSSGELQQKFILWQRISRFMTQGDSRLPQEVADDLEFKATTKKHTEQLDSITSELSDLKGSLEGLQKTTESHFQSLNDKIDKNHKTTQTNTSLFLQRFTLLDTSIRTIQQQAEKFHQRFDTIDTKFDTLNKKFDTFQQDMTEIKTALTILVKKEELAQDIE